MYSVRVAASRRAFVASVQLGGRVGVGLKATCWRGLCREFLRARVEGCSFTRKVGRGM